MSPATVTHPALEFLRDAIIDVAAARGVGVNGMNVVRYEVRGGLIELGVRTPFRWTRPPVVVFRRAEPARR